MKGIAVVLAPGAYKSDNAKTAHGLVRGSERFDIVGVVDAGCAGEDAGKALDGKERGIPIFASLGEAMDRARLRPDTCIVGLAPSGGAIPAYLRAPLLEAARKGLSIVSGLHDYVGDDAEIAAAAAASGARIFDVRRSKPKTELHFWTGDIAQVRAPRLAVLGTDCALGKRTTARLTVELCRANGIRAEMIYTGQTGWMQGGRYGFVLDSVYNDFVSGEIEHAIVECDRAEHPDLIVLEGQSALRNPSGPCGSELIVSGQAGAVILQHAPGRKAFKGRDDRWLVPPLEEELELVRLYGSEVVAITLNNDKIAPQALIGYQKTLAARLGLPVVRPLEEGVEALLPVVRDYLGRKI